MEFRSGPDLDYNGVLTYVESIIILCEAWADGVQRALPYLGNWVRFVYDNHFNVKGNKVCTYMYFTILYKY